MILDSPTEVLPAAQWLWDDSRRRHRYSAQTKPEVPIGAGTASVSWGPQISRNGSQAIYKAIAQRPQADLLLAQAEQLLPGWCDQVSVSLWLAIQRTPQSLSSLTGAQWTSSRNPWIQQFNSVDSVGTSQGTTAKQEGEEEKCGRWEEKPTGKKNGVDPPWQVWSITFSKG